MKAIAEFLVDSSNTIEEKGKQVPLYEHAGLHMILRKLIAHDEVLMKNNKSKTNFLTNLILLNLNLFIYLSFCSYIF